MFDWFIQHDVCYKTLISEALLGYNSDIRYLVETVTQLKLIKWQWLPWLVLDLCWNSNSEVRTFCNCDKQRFEIQMGNMHTLSPLPTAPNKASLVLMLSRVVPRRTSCHWILMIITVTFAKHIWLRLCWIKFNKFLSPRIIKIR